MSFHYLADVLVALLVAATSLVVLDQLADWLGWYDREADR